MKSFQQANETQIIPTQKPKRTPLCFPK